MTARRVESDVGGDRAGRSPGAPRGRASRRGRARASGARRGVRPGRGRCRPLRRPSQDHALGRLDPGPQHQTDYHGFLCYRPPRHEYQPRTAPAPSADGQRQPWRWQSSGRRGGHRLPALPVLDAPAPRRRRRGGGGVRVQRVQPGPARPQDRVRHPHVRRADDRLRPDRQGRARPIRPGPAPGHRRLRPALAGTGRRDDVDRG